MPSIIQEYGFLLLAINVVGIQIGGAFVWLRLLQPGCKHADHKRADNLRQVADDVDTRFDGQTADMT